MKVLLVAIVALSATVASAHKFHASITELELNAKSKRVEVALRVFNDDLERALSAGKDTGVRLDATADVDKLILAYLKQQLIVRNGSGKSSEWKWVGKESDAQTTWIYVEGVWNNDRGGVTISNKLFFELFDDQVNSVNVNRDGKRTGLAFTRGDEAKKLD